MDYSERESLNATTIENSIHQRHKQTAPLLCCMTLYTLVDIPRHSEHMGNLEMVSVVKAAMLMLHLVNCANQSLDYRTNIDCSTSNQFMYKRKLIIWINWKKECCINSVIIFIQHITSRHTYYRQSKSHLGLHKYG